MSFFNPEIPVLKEKVVSHHPWEKYIKDIYSSTYKYGHNSANNLVYPPKKDKKPLSSNRVKITVIGNRVTKEFIYCMNLAKGLHKYRSQHFEAPVIRGVTSVEWPRVWNDLKIQYGGMAFCLRSQVAVIVNDQFLGGDKEFKELIESKYYFYIRPDYYDEAIKQFSSFIKSSGRPCAYLQISIDDDSVGTLLFMLYSDIVPHTCENFLRLCTTKRGGYSGTPVHRIVKDCWIQCGGFGLKSTDLDCENFIVPHDRRGVLCMANNGRHVDCSTQFFVLLQPAQWMAFKYVAFGQLIDGEETLQKIEQVPTYYESPTKNIVIHKSGVFNMECQDIKINKNTKEYIQGHIENLFSIGELFIEELMEKVFLEVDFRQMQRLQEEMAGEGAAEAEVVPEEVNNLRATQRFMRKKEEIDKQIEKSAPRPPDKTENNDFDVEEYAYEPEEYSYKHASAPASITIPVIPERPYYIPMTDVSYPGDVDSTYDLKKVLKGDYCLECDIDKDAKKKRKADLDQLSFPSEIFDLLAERASTSGSSQETLDSEDEKEIKKYLKNNADRVSFAGGIVKTMAKGGKLNLFENARKSELITDDELRRFRLASVEYRARDKKVSISLPSGKDQHREIKRRQTGFVRPEDLARIKLIQKANAALEGDQDVDEDDENYAPYTRQVSISTPQSTEAKATQKLIKRRQTGFVRPDDLEKIHIFRKTSEEDNVEEEEEEEEEERTKVRIVQPTPPSAARSGRRPTGYVRPSDLSKLDLDEIEVERPSVLTRLYDDVAVEDEEGTGPTLKDFRPASESHPKTSIFLTMSPNFRNVSDEDVRERFVRRSILDDEKTVDQVLDLQHGKKVTRKISSDYVKTIDHIEHKLENSLRSIEFAKTRPAMSVVEYQKKNQMYQQEMLSKSKLALGGFRESKDESKKAHSSKRKAKGRGLRLPGDTPLYSSLTEMTEQH